MPHEGWSTVALAPEESHYETMADLFLRGRLVYFLGAGVNLCGRPEAVTFELGRYLPSGAELATHLAKYVHYNRPDPDDLVRVAQFVDISLGSGPLYEYLHEVFDADYAPTAVHTMLASLPALIRAHRPAGQRMFPLIVTTNYDHCLEQAFEAAGEPYDLITYIAEGPDRGKFRHTRPGEEPEVIEQPKTYFKQIPFTERATIAKIHGTVAREADEDDSFVVTENHYISYLSADEFESLIPKDIFIRMNKCHFLFLGYSLRDWNLRVILQRLWGDRAKYQHWSIQHGTDRIEEKAWSQKNVDLLDADLADYVAHLTRTLAARPVGVPT